MARPPIVIAADRCRNSRRSMRPWQYSSYRSKIRWSISACVNARGASGATAGDSTFDFSSIFDSVSGSGPKRDPRILLGAAPPATSNQPQPLQARVTVLADNDVVVHRNPERTRHGDDRQIGRAHV